MLVGLGYNFIPFVVDKEYIVTNFDASLLNLIIALGIPLSLVVFLCLTRWLLFSFKGLKLVNFTLYVSLSTYLIASIIMSFFNNLLFYPFYLLTVLPLLAYGYWEGRENRV